MAMRKNKFNKISIFLRRLPLGMALHPFLTFLAGFVAAMIVAGGFLVAFTNFIETDAARAQSESSQLQKIDSKNCLNVFADWEKQKIDADNFSQSDIYDPFFSTSTVGMIDQSQK